MDQDDEIMLAEIAKRHKQTWHPISEVVRSGYIARFRVELDRVHNQAMLDGFLKTLPPDSRGGR